MYTYEMIGIADQNDRTYKCEYGTYNKKDGFVLNDRGQKIPRDSLLQIMFHENLWSLVKEPEPKKMTLQDIEKELGYRVKIVDNNDSKQYISDDKQDIQHRKEVDDAIDMFENLFGFKFKNREDYY